ncbi:hypothetical protein [Cellulophaga omnivescoria]|uniref:hypothetical protein n=1 Tax=Cellulophaga omnivescoria TaxID=1888890 RepID=UPI0022F00631|nr:hypothetical protein [Cellulophaga omnivescoria]WBU88542.1 hypothetical protein PBN93_11735 [Cellulophaga omnivescoria]
MFIRYTYIITVVFLALLFTDKSAKRHLVQSNNEIKHHIKVHHPGKGQNNIEDAVLVEVKGKNNLPVSYYMDVESVICYENLCKIVPVRIIWNTIGEYQKYELAKGVALEKYEREPYTEEDYSKTQKILLDVDSPFKSIRIDEILTTVKSHDIVDAVAGETLLELNEDDTVDGASLTCYTLWHWAHGAVVEKIKEVTASNFSSKNYIAYLNSDNLQKQLFALTYVNLQKKYEKDVVAAVTQNTLKNNNLVRNAILYAENGSEDTYLSTLKTFITKGNTKLKIAALNSLLNANTRLNSNYVTDLSLVVSKNITYYETALFLRILQQNKQAVTSNLISNLMPLLQKDIVISRNVYWFLKGENLTTLQQKVLNNFAKKHKNQL